MQTAPISLRYFVVQAMGDTNSGFSDSFTKVPLIPCEKLTGSSNYNRQGYEDQLTTKVDTIPAAKLVKWKKTIASLGNNQNRFRGGLSNSKPHPKCDHCNLLGHPIDRCWKLHGRPPRQVNAA